jgi:hypothetical protein
MKASKKPEKNSLDDKASRDPSLQELLRLGRETADEDVAAFEEWAKKGASSRGSES